MSTKDSNKITVGNFYLAKRKNGSEELVMKVTHVQYGYLLCQVFHPNIGSIVNDEVIAVDDYNFEPLDKHRALRKARMQFRKSTKQKELELTKRIASMRDDFEENTKDRERNFSTDSKRWE